MILLTSSMNNFEIIFSGIIAAVISGMVSLIGVHYQNKNAKNSLDKQEENNRESLEIQKKNNEASIKAQRDIANLEKNEKIFYESQLRWANDLREHLAKIIGLIPQYNDLYLQIYMMGHEPDSALGKERSRLAEIDKENTDRMVNTGKKLQEEIGIVRMLLFNKDSSYEMEIENRLNEIMTWIIHHDTVDLMSVEYLTQAAKKYFANLMKELEKKKV